MTEPNNNPQKAPMQDNDIKCRIISFRFSDHEYGIVEDASRKLGFLSVAAFARAATLTCNPSETVNSPLDVELDRLWRRIETLTTTLETLAADFSAALDSSKWTGSPAAG